MLNTTSLSEQIEEHLKREILSGELESGQRLSIEEIADRLGVSAMPVRDAVRRLDNLGFLRVVPRVGVFVAEFDEQQFKNIMDIRIALESLAIERATPLIPLEEVRTAIQRYQAGGDHLEKTGDESLLRQCDNLVHNLVISHCENPKLIEMMSQLQDLIRWAHRIVDVYQPNALAKALPEHLAILAALETRDIVASQNNLRMHLQRTLKSTLEAWHTKANE